MDSFDNLLIKVFFNDKKLSNYYYKFIYWIKKNKYSNIKNYLENRYNDLEGGKTIYKESLYRILFKVNIRKKCPICGKPTRFNPNKEDLYCDHCSRSCEMKNKNVRDKINEKCLKLYGSINNSNKAKETNLKKYGVDNPAKSNIIKEKIIKTNIDKYGASSPLLNENIKEKTKKTNLEKYGNEIAQKNIKVKEKIKQSNIDTCLRKYSKTNIMQLAENKQKQKETCLKKYGVPNIVYSKTYRDRLNEINNKRNITKQNNNSFNKSKDEELSYEILKNVFINVIRQYSNDIYPFVCDFYIEDLDLYIECNYHWTHGKHPYNSNNKEDIDLVKLWKDKNTKFYENAIKTWTIRDPQKREIAKQNKLNYIEFWNISELKYWLKLLLNPLIYKCDIKTIIKEYLFYKDHKGEIKAPNSKNDIVKYFQQDQFFIHENILYSNIKIANKLILNRMQYLNKTSILELTMNDLLLGFKRSSIYNSYSHFNPLLFKWFIENYNIKSCYDPCGGWGHRLIGSHNLDLYIYNDLSISVFNNVNKIIEFFNISNCITYNNDANNFIPEEDFDSMFTCPPYYNLEHYECGDFKDMGEYNQFIDNLFKCFYSKDTCKIFGLVIREDLLDMNKYVPTNKFIISNKKSFHIHKTIKHKNNEYLYIFKK